jgi:outer membrane protein assembly factor BamA
MKAVHRFAILLSGILLTGPLVPAQTTVKVTGLGIFGNLDMERRLTFLNGAYDSEVYEMDARELEDSAYIILQQLKRDGHPAPVVEASIKFTGQREATHSWTLPFKSLAREEYDWEQIDSVRFACDPGRLNYYKSVNVEGVDALEEDSVIGFYLPSGVLFTRKENLAFTEGNLKARTARLLASLRNKGYMQAEVAEELVEVDEVSGEVSVDLTIEQGPVHLVGSIHTSIMENNQTLSASQSDDHRGEPLNYEWLREYRQELINHHYAAGFPDASLTVERTIEPAPDDGGTLYVNLAYTLERGMEAELTGIQFEPQDILKPSILRRTVELKVDEPFDLLAVEEGRRNLLSLGILNDVDLEHVKVAVGQRIASYTMTPLPKQKLKLRAGWGSYERARVGLRWERLNLWNRAHRYDVEVEYSTKSANADLTYVIPHFFDKRITAYARTGHEFREEISYDRTTTTFLLGATRRLEKRDIELSVEYSLEKQDAERESVTTFSSADQATVSSLTVRGILDRRDSVLYPTSGYDLTLESKSALEALGGNANFQKVEFSGSYHKYLWNAMYAHISFRYGGIFSRSPASENLPFNERFFLGGENTIRGYQQGEASPMDPNGQLIGAEAYALANVELEQRLFSSLSAVVFWDGLGQSVDRETVPDREILHTVGIGVRFRTPVGPVRLEYGHNLNPRPGDPDGTLHIAVGYPF